MLVVDASVACKWFVAEPQAEAAARLLEDGSGLIAPDLIVPEVCNIARLKARRGEISALHGAAILSGLPQLLDELVPSATLARRAFAIASDIGHPAYDCFYLALAEARDTRLITADLRLISRLAGTAWVPLAVALG